MLLNVMLHNAVTLSALTENHLPRHAECLRLLTKQGTGAQFNVEHYIFSLREYSFDKSMGKSQIYIAFYTFHWITDDTHTTYMSHYFNILYNALYFFPFQSR